jgi:hypothetical protein
VPQLKATAPGSAWATSTSTIAPQGTRQRSPRLADLDCIFLWNSTLQNKVRENPNKVAGDFFSPVFNPRTKSFN